MTGQPQSPSESLVAAHQRAVKRLLDSRTPNGLWEGRLSGSALATAVAIGALREVDAPRHSALICRGRDWLASHQNDDGGWGDTPDSLSNLPTTLLCWAALGYVACDKEGRVEAARNGAALYLERHTGDLDPQSLEKAVLSRYGNDRTFSAPILAFAALCGALGKKEECWHLVPQLPFELAWCPPALFDWVGMPVVTYAIPALIAIGLVRHRRQPTAEPLRARLRDWASEPVLRRLTDIQPDSGGFLEAVPLTGFVAICLAGADLANHPVTQAATHFLAAAVRPDGCWPIDSNLATWNTTLAIKALAATPRSRLSPSVAEELRGLLLSQQFKAPHPYTRAAPGGWAWTNLPGGVPDADDTAGALVALHALGAQDDATQQAAISGTRWLLDLQNRDGGWPTFCRGVGRLPFDQSCADITAHAMRALDLWYDDSPRSLQARIDTAMASGIGYLEDSMREEGSWTPLWFGSQQTPDQANPTYGTARVVQALAAMTPERLPPIDRLEQAGCRWLLTTQHADGGWGADAQAPPTIEETALAVEALATAGYHEAAQRGAQWLMEATDEGRHFPTSPIGLYFASLWYSEAQYPLSFFTAALGALLQP